MKGGIKPPDFVIEDVEDAYVYYVLILKIPEDLFWYADVSFVIEVVENMDAYNSWLNYARQKELEG